MSTPLRAKIATLESKLKEAENKLEESIQTQHELAGLTINFELQKMQSIAMAHGVMGTLITTKNILTTAGVDITVDPAYLEIEQISQVRIAQCVQALSRLGMDIDEINKRIQQGN